MPFSTITVKSCLVMCFVIKINKKIQEQKNLFTNYINYIFLKVVISNIREVLLVLII